MQERCNSIANILELCVFDGLVHERRNSIANTLELRLFALTHRYIFNAMSYTVTWDILTCKQIIFAKQKFHWYYTRLLIMWKKKYYMSKAETKVPYYA